MSLRTRIRGFTSWVNLRLKSSDQMMNNVIMDLLSGTNMKILIESMTGRIMKRVQSFDGLSDQQKITRIEWVLQELKSCNVIPQDIYLDCRMFAMRNADTVFQLIWRMIEHDIWFVWERSEFLQHKDPDIVCAVPFKWVPEPPPVKKKTQKVTKSYLSGFGAASLITEDIPDEPDSNDEMDGYEPFPGADVMKSYKSSNNKNHSFPRAERCIMELVAAHLQMTKEGRKLNVLSLDDLVDSRVLCALTNSFVPNLFTSDVLLNDRWTINLVLRTAESMWYVQSLFDSEDLVQSDMMAMCSYLCSFFMVGYKYRQSAVVVQRDITLKRSINNCDIELSKFPPSITDIEVLKRKKDVMQAKRDYETSVTELEKLFDVKFCYKWVSHVEDVRKRTKKIIKEKMRCRFEVISVPRNITINDLCLSMVVNLNITGGSGFYKASGKESFAEGRRIVLRRKDTRQFLDDFSVKVKDSTRRKLGLSETAVVDVNPDDYQQYDMYFESQSRNKQLKTGTMFLYQVFPGNTTNWQRLYLKAAKDGEIDAVVKLVTFFRDRSAFINCKEKPQRNTALYLAAKNGHMSIVKFLLENGGNINAKNAFRCSPIFGAVEGLHREICHLLIECGCDMNIKNVGRQTVFETVKNEEFKNFLKKLHEHYTTVCPKIMSGDIELLAKVVKEHRFNIRPLCCLTSRCVNGSTLLHTAAYFGAIDIVKELLQMGMDVNLGDYKEASPLHRAKDTQIIQILIECGANIDHDDLEGNTPMHVKCYGQNDVPSDIDCIKLLLNNGASLTIRNNYNLMAIHCAAMQGRIDVLDLLLKFDENGDMRASLLDESSKKPPSLVNLAISNDFLECAEWLLQHGLNFKEGEQDILFQKIITKQVSVKKCSDDVRFLLEHGADPNPQYSGGNSALHFASTMSEHPDLLKVLLEYGADPDFINDEQNTPLFFATRCGNHFAANILIAHGADIRHRNGKGLTAFDCISDYEEWITSGVFSAEIQARLKAYQLKHARDLVRAISAKVKRPKASYDRLKSAQTQRFAHHAIEAQSAPSSHGTIALYGFNRSSTSLSAVSSRTLNHSFHQLGLLPRVKHVI